ncbi:MAG TPA: LysR family transcriptional regulator [Candidatus Sulfotelmatobacter sp.]|nr:LysR family transcriptional regulator [Candidatus Sulfotelmatobacter sp.]
MELRNLRALVEVVRRTTFSGAAKELFATQSAVSKAVKQLEDELGMLLFERNGRNSRLTDAGEIAYKRAASILAETKDLVTELSELRGLNRGKLRLGLPSMGGILFAKSFALFRRQYPNIEVQLFEHGGRRLEELLLAGDIELAASIFPLNPEFESQPIARQPLKLFTSAAHVLAKRKTVGLRMLSNIPFILFESGFVLNKRIADACKRQGFAPKIAACSSQVDFIVELVAANVGVAILPEMFAEQFSNRGVTALTIDDPQMEWHMALIWRRGGYLSSAARAWKAMICESQLAKVSRRGLPKP